MLILWLPEERLVLLSGGVVESAGAIMELFLTRIRADALPAFKVSVVVTHRLLGLLLFAHEHLGDSLLEH